MNCSEIRGGHLQLKSVLIRYYCPSTKQQDTVMQTEGLIETEGKWRLKSYIL